MAAATAPTSLVFTPTADDGLAFARLPALIGTDLLAILDRVIRRIARRIADETGDYDAAGDFDPCPDLLASGSASACRWIFCSKRAPLR